MKKKAPGGLMAVCIIAIVFGVFGILGSGFGVLGAVFGERMQKAFTPKGARNAPMAQQQEQFQKEIRDVADKWAPVTYTLLAVLMVVAVCLIVGGVQAMRLQLNGRQLLMMTFLLAIVFELVRVVPMVGIQMETLDVTEQYMADMMKGPPGGPPPPPAARRIMETSMKAGMVIGFVFAGVWLLMKLGFYGFGVMYLRRPRTVALYGAAGDIDWQDDDADWQAGQPE